MKGNTKRYQNKQELEREWEGGRGAVGRAEEGGRERRRGEGWEVSGGKDGNKGRPGIAPSTPEKGMPTTFLKAI